MIENFKNQKVQWIVLAILVITLITVIFSPRLLKINSTHAEVNAVVNEVSRQKRTTGQHEIVEPDDANSRYAFKPFPGVVSIERDLQAVSPFATDPTALDGMDREQLTAFRLAKVGKYRQLGFYHSGYSPFSPPHNRIYAPITPGVEWLYSVPYYLANPYLLIVLVSANHVTPIDIYVREATIRYQNGKMTETIQGDSARQWFEYVYSSQDYPGTIRLVMVNAWDAGFRYIHLDPSLSTNIELGEHMDNVTRFWHSQHSFFHVGKYKKNNLSPEDRRGWVKLRKRDEPTRLHVKLWRSQPGDIDDRADLIFIFDIDSHAT